MAALFRETSGLPSGCLGRVRSATVTAAMSPRALVDRRTLSTTAACHARLVVRPRRPYQFTQIVQLSDGSTYSVRTTSPQALHRSAKDSRNHILWQPSEKSLHNVEVDEAGKLAAFRSRFGRNWDLAQVSEAPVADDKTKGAKGAKAAKADKADEADKAAEAAAAPPATDAFDDFADLLSGYAAKEGPRELGGITAKEQARRDKGKKKRK